MPENADINQGTIPQLTKELRRVLDVLDRSGWWQEDQDHANALMGRLNAVLDNNARGPRPPRKLRVRDIRDGDVYKEGDRVLWTALRPAEVGADNVTVKVRYPDYGTGYRIWEGEDRNFELPGLERP